MPKFQFRVTHEYFCAHVVDNDINIATADQLSLLHLYPTSYMDKFSLISFPIRYYFTSALYIIVFLGMAWSLQIQVVFVCIYAQKVLYEE